MPGGARRGKGRWSVYQGAQSSQSGRAEGKEGPGGMDGGERTGIFATEVLQFRQAEKTPFPKKDGGLWNADPELIHRGLGCSQMQGGGGGGLRAGLKGRLEVARS